MRLFCALAMLACTLPLSATSLAAPCELTISAAASLTGAFKAIASQYQQLQPCKLTLNFAASGVLVQQLRHGAPVDLLATADQQSMDLAEASALIDPASRQDFIANRLVLIVPVSPTTASPQAGSTATAATTSNSADLQQLTAAAYQRIAIGNPATVPAGRYAKDSLQQAGLWPALSAKLVQAANVRQVLDYVVRGEAEAGFVYASDAKDQQVRSLGMVPVQSPIRYPLAVSSTSKYAAQARAFSQYLRSQAAQQILWQYGFSPIE